MAKAVLRQAQDVLDLPSDEISRPKPIPAGHYVFQVVGLPREDKSTKKQTPFTEYTCKPIHPWVPEEGEADVDTDALAQMGGFGERTLRLTFYNTDDAVYRHKDFLSDLDIPIEDEDGKALTTRQRIPMAPNRRFIGHVKHSSSDDGKAQYANIVSTAKLED